MYQLTNYGGSGLQVVTPDPPDAGGAAINANFKVLATTVAAADPGSDDDATAGFGTGSRWYNSDTTVEWICLDATPGAAEWAAIASGSLAGYLPLSGGRMTGALSMAAHSLNMNTGGGTGGGTLNMDGGTLNMDGGDIGNCISLVCQSLYAYSTGALGVHTALDMLGYALNMNTGFGYGGLKLSMDGGLIQTCNSLQLNATTAPGSPAPGMVYFDSSTNQMNYWNGTAWVAW